MIDEEIGGSKRDEIFATPPGDEGQVKRQTFLVMSVLVLFMSSQTETKF